MTSAKFLGCCSSCDGSGSSPHPAPAMWTLRKENIYLTCCQRIWKPCQNNIILLCNFLTLVFIAPVFGHDLWPVWWIFLLKLEFTIWDKWSIERSVYASKRGMDILHMQLPVSPFPPLHPHPAATGIHHSLSPSDTERRARLWKTAFSLSLLQGN